ncbi:Zinc finger FYVE domain-containing protein 1-like protein, partial [Dinothrombium tinctorium]
QKPEAVYLCAECASFQCSLCEELIHEKAQLAFHSRNQLQKPSESVLCQFKCEDRNFADLFCNDCNRNYCFECDSKFHYTINRKRHCRQEFDVRLNEDLSEDEFTSCPPFDYKSENTNYLEQRNNDVVLTIDDEIESNRSEQNMSTTLPDIAQLSLESQFESLNSHKADEGTAIMNLEEKDIDANKWNTSFLLIDEFENMQVSSSDEFCQKLSCSPSATVKVVSIFGNTGEGKSHTMNYTFFSGKEIFETSPAQHSCTIGIWVAYDPILKVIAVDTEGLLGVSKNNNRRTRLLLKVLAVSDIVIYRTRAERLHNDLFTFLGDASKAYMQHFSAELKAATQRCNLSCTLSDLGPVVVVFHETLHTDVLQRDETSNETPEDILRQRFQNSNLSIDAFSAVEYVGTRTVNPPTCFKDLRMALQNHLRNSTVRSARPPGVIFSALRHLNEKFSGDLERSVPSTFPDEYFTCCAKCLSCGNRCINSMNHVNEGISHKTAAKCKYQHQFDNRMLFCKVCYDRGEEIMVVPKASASNDPSWIGLAKYAWSGYVLECSNCGIIYRSRQYWYGNKDPWESTVRTEVQHVWPGETSQCQGTQNAAQRIVDGVNYFSETVSTISAKPSKMVSSWVADQIAPSYWIPNWRITHCGLCGKEFKELDQKHHCRACGGGFCENCSSRARPVPERGWGEAPVRVCDPCYHKGLSHQDIQSRHSDANVLAEEAECSNSDNAEVTARKVGEVLHSTLGTVVSAMDYPKGKMMDKRLGATRILGA